MTVFSYDQPEHAEREREIQSIRYAWRELEDKRKELYEHLAKLDQQEAELRYESMLYKMQPEDF